MKLSFFGSDHLKFFVFEKWISEDDTIVNLDWIAECCNVECFMSTNSMWKVIKTMGLLTDDSRLKLKKVQFKEDVP